MRLPGCCYRTIATTCLSTGASPPYDESGTQRSSETVEKCGTAHSAIVASHSERSKHCWRRLTISHRARSHFSHSDVPGLKLATSPVAATRWSAYGTTVTCEAPAHCGAARNLASTKASSSVLVLGDLFVMSSTATSSLLCRRSLLKRDPASSGAKGWPEAWVTQIRRARIRGHGRNKLRTT